MKLAIAYDYDIPADIRREGIGVFAIYLLNAIMEYHNDIKLEFWTYSFNKENIKIVFKDIFEKYPNRVKIFDESHGYKKSVELKKIIPCFPIYFKIFKYRLKYFFLRRKRYLDKISSIHVQLLVKLQEGIEQLKYGLVDLIDKYSKADFVYCFFVSLKIGKYFSCPKFVQVHDLFTIPLYDLFKEDFGAKNLEKSNKMILDNLEDYALKDTVFISSSKYIANEHSLKYIPNIKSKQIAVIPFPPMIKDFNDALLIDKQTFKSKYKIGDIYIAFPSQNRPNKNWIVILEALKILRDKDIKIQFVTTGKVDSVIKTKNFAKENRLDDLIVEVGSLSVEELYALYKYSNLVVGSSIIEGMGISGQVLEALKVGNIPIIHTKSLGIKESLENVGLTMETADLNWFDFDDSKTLAKLIEEVIKNPQPHIEKQRKVLEAYTKITWKDVADNYVRLFKGKK